MITTLVIFETPSLSLPLLLVGRFVVERNPSSPSGAFRHLQAGADRLGPLAHGLEPDPPASVRAPAPLDADAVVLHEQTKHRRSGDERYPDFARARVAERVRDGLLCDPEDLGFDAGREPRLAARF